MLQDKSLGSPTVTHGFLVAVEVDESVVTPEQIANKLGDALAWVEGTGFIDVAPMGKIDTLDEDEVNNE